MRNNNRRQILNKATTQHQENLQKNLQRRMETACSSGDKQLMKTLQGEAAYLDIYL
ncbi:MAG: hypothetical protein AB4290_08695 [Spirulina sp.]